MLKNYTPTEIEEIKSKHTTVKSVKDYILSQVRYENPGLAHKITELLAQEEENSITNLIYIVTNQNIFAERIKKCADKLNSNLWAILQLQNDQQREELGCRIFDISYKDHPKYASKITGMLLEARSSEELIDGLQNRNKLYVDLDEAICLLCHKERK